VHHEGRHRDRTQRRRAVAAGPAGHGLAQHAQLVPVPGLTGPVGDPTLAGSESRRADDGERCTTDATATRISKGSDLLQLNSQPLDIEGSQIRAFGLDLALELCSNTQQPHWSS
jgi:hypothetical protein